MTNFLSAHEGSNNVRNSIIEDGNNSGTHLLSLNVFIPKYFLALTDCNLCFTQTL
jgi:hypothetical protein